MQSHRTQDTPKKLRKDERIPEQTNELLTRRTTGQIEGHNERPGPGGHLGKISVLSHQSEGCYVSASQSKNLSQHVEKAPCTDLRSDPTLLPKFLQNYAGGRVHQPRTPNTSAARKSLN